MTYETAVNALKLGALILRMRGGAEHSTHMRTPEIYKKSSKSMILKMNQDTYGDFLGYQEWLRMISDTTRLHIS